MRLGVKDVAERLGVSERTVFQWVEREALPATQVPAERPHSARQSGLNAAGAAVRCDRSRPAARANRRRQAPE